MSPTLTVETADLAAGAHILSDQVGDPLWSAVGQALREAASCTGMAGDDPTGLAWATQYGSSAPLAAQAAEDVINGAYRLSSMLAATADNYARADAASTIGERHAVDEVIADLPGPVEVTLGTRFGDVGGAASSAPYGWSLIEHMVRMAWPDGHQDRLREAAAAWNRSADALSGHASDVDLAALDAIRDDLLEWHDIRTACWSLAGHVRDVADAHRSLGRACAQLAHHLDVAHAEIGHEVVVLLAESAAIETAGAAVSFLTAGLAEAPTQAAEAARVSATVARIVALLTEFGTAVREVVLALPLVAEISARVSSALESLLSIRIVAAEVTGVSGLRVLSIARDGRSLGDVTEAAGEVGAEARLSEDAAGTTQNFVDKAGARKALPLHWGSPARKFLRGATGKSRDYRLTRLSNGNYELSFFSSADNAGYGKLYVKVLDTDGESIEEYKDTLGPDGFIMRKWVSGGPS